MVNLCSGYLPGSEIRLLSADIRSVGLPACHTTWQSWESLASVQSPFSVLPDSLCPIAENRGILEWRAKTEQLVSHCSNQGFEGSLPIESIIFLTRAIYILCRLLQHNENVSSEGGRLLSTVIYEDTGRSLPTCRRSRPTHTDVRPPYGWSYKFRPTLPKVMYDINELFSHDH